MEQDPRPARWNQLGSHSGKSMTCPQLFTPCWMSLCCRLEAPAGRSPVFNFIAFGKSDAVIHGKDPSDDIKGSKRSLFPPKRQQVLRVRWWTSDSLTAKLQNVTFSPSV